VGHPDPALTPVQTRAPVDDRFQVLAGGRRHQRQRTLEATLDWSYDLLDPDEQRVFRTLGVFVDGFDLDAAAAVAGVCQIILGMPARALETVAELDACELAFYDGAEVRTLAHLQLGDIARARELLLQFWCGRTPRRFRPESEWQSSATMNGPHKRRIADLGQVHHLCARHLR
jgi:hypothetical protein